MSREWLHFLFTLRLPAPLAAPSPPIAAGNAKEINDEWEAMFGICNSFPLQLEAMSDADAIRF